MNNLSKHLKLSKIYTKHSLCVTHITDKEPGHGTTSKNIWKLWLIFWNQNISWLTTCHATACRVHQTNFLDGHSTEITVPPTLFFNHCRKWFFSMERHIQNRDCRNSSRSSSAVCSRTQYNRRVASTSESGCNLNVTLVNIIRSTRRMAPLLSRLLHWKNIFQHLELL